MSGRVPTEEGELGCAELGWSTLSSPRQLKPEALQGWGRACTGLRRHHLLPTPTPQTH